MKRSLVFATPDLFGQIGGIARISRATALAMASWARKRGALLEVLALCDTGEEADKAYVPGDVGTYRAFRGDRRAFACAVAQAGWRPGHVATVFGHVNLAVTGLLQPAWARQALVAHGIEIWDPFPGRRLDRRLALRRQNSIWPISRYTAERLQSAHGVGQQRIRVITNGLDPQWQPRTKPNGDVAFGRPRVLAVCSLARGFEYKGIDSTIEAISRLPMEERPMLDVVGDGDDRPRLEKVALSRGVVENVTFHGRISDEALTALYATARAFVLPSTHEGFGLVFIEAMAHGLPVITVAAGAAPEVVEDGVTGCVVAEGDISALATAIGVLSGDPDRARRLGENGRERVIQRYLFDSYAERMAAALDALTA